MLASQFMVDRDGTIYRLMPETALARHIIGYNWCAIGIENVGGANNKKEDLTPAQLKANIKLIRYLHAKYPTIQYVFGHYQQVTAQ
jgi:N-acetylmuramoyl-L-alanine amidase